MRLICKSIIIQDMKSSNPTQYREGRVIRKEWTTQTTYDMGSVQDHTIEIPDRAFHDKAMTRLRGPGNADIVLVPLLGMLPVAVLLGLAYLAEQTKGLLFLDHSVAYLAPLWILGVLFWIAWRTRNRYVLYYGLGRQFLIVDEVRKARSLPDETRLEVIPAEQWDAFVANLRGPELRNPFDKFKPFGQNNL